MNMFWGRGAAAPEEGSEDEDEDEDLQEAGDVD